MSAGTLCTVVALSLTGAASGRIQENPNEGRKASTVRLPWGDSKGRFQTTAEWVSALVKTVVVVRFLMIEAV
jgi:hypothetical protein